MSDENKLLKDYSKQLAYCVAMTESNQLSKKEKENLKELREEIDRRLKAFDWYNKHYHLPDELKHLEKGVSLEEWKKNRRI